MCRAELCNRADDVHTYPWGCARSYHTKNAWKPWKTIINPLAERPRVRWRQRVHFHHRRLTTRGDATTVAGRRVRTATLPRRAALTSGTGVIVFTFTGSRARLGPRSTQVDQYCRVTAYPRVPRSHTRVPVPSCYHVPTRVHPRRVFRVGTALLEKYFKCFQNASKILFSKSTFRIKNTLKWYFVQHKLRTFIFFL